MNAVLVDNNGTCSNIKISKKKKNIFFNSQILYEHYRNIDENILIMSTYKVEDIITDADIMQFSMPPPLNYYVYPHNIIILRGTENKPSNLSCQTLLEICAKFKENIKKIETNLTVYDVPLDEVVYESSEGEEEEEPECYNSEEDEQDDDEDWDEDEDNAVD